MIIEIPLGIVLGVVLLYALPFLLIAALGLLVLAALAFGIAYLVNGGPTPASTSTQPIPWQKRHALPAGVALPPGFSQYEPDVSGKCGNGPNGPIVDFECGHAIGPDGQRHHLARATFNTGQETWMIWNWPNHTQCTDTEGCKTHLYVKNAGEAQWHSSYRASDHHQHAELILGTDGQWHDQLPG